MTSKLYKVPEDFAALAHLKHADYLRLYQESVRDPHAFSSRIGRRLDWIQTYSKAKDTSYDERTSASAGSTTASSTSPRTVSIVTSPSAATRLRSCGRATTRGCRSGSRTVSCTSVYVSARMR